MAAKRKQVARDSATVTAWYSRASWFALYCRDYAPIEGARKEGPFDLNTIRLPADPKTPAAKLDRDAVGPKWWDGTLLRESTREIGILAEAFGIDSTPVNSLYRALEYKARMAPNAATRDLIDGARAVVDRIANKLGADLAAERAPSALQDAIIKTLQKHGPQGGPSLFALLRGKHAALVSMDWDALRDSHLAPLIDNGVRRTGRGRATRYDAM